MNDPTSSTHVEILSERIEAQIQAHDKYSQAFIKILETLDHINGNIQTLETSDTYHVRELVKEISVIAEDLRNHDQYSQIMKNDIDKKIEEYKEEAGTLIDELYLQRHFVEGIVPSIKDISKNLNDDYLSVMEAIQNSQDRLQTAINQMDDMVNLKHSNHKVIYEEITKIKHQVTGIEGSMQIALSQMKEILDIAKNSISSISEKLKCLDKLEQISAQVQSLYETRQGWKRINMYIFIYGGAIGTLLVIVQALIQLGILKIAWAPVTH